MSKSALSCRCQDAEAEAEAGHVQDLMFPVLTSLQSESIAVGGEMGISSASREVLSSIPHRTHLHSRGNSVAGGALLTLFQKRPEDSGIHDSLIDCKPM